MQGRDQRSGEPQQIETHAVSNRTDPSNAQVAEDRHLVSIGDELYGGVGAREVGDLVSEYGWLRLTSEERNRVAREDELAIEEGSVDGDREAAEVASRLALVLVQQTLEEAGDGGEI